MREREARAAALARLLPAVGREQDFDWKPLARICRQFGAGIVPEARKGLFGRTSVERSARQALERVPQEVKERLADRVDALGQSAAFRALGAPEQQQVLKQQIFDAFVLHASENLLQQHAVPGQEDAARLRAQVEAYLRRMFGVETDAGSGPGAQAGAALQVGAGEMARGSRFLELLADDARQRGLYRTVDEVIDLSHGPAQATMAAVLKQALVDSWDKSDKSSHLGPSGPNQQVRTDFERDLINQQHFLVDRNGKQTLCARGQDLVDFIGAGKHREDLPLVLSHIANQKLGTALRQFLNDYPDTPLRASDGEALMPLLKGRASYYFRRLDSGRVELRYHFHAPEEAGRTVYRRSERTRMLARQTVAPARLELELKIVVEPDGQWLVDGLRIQARNFHQIS